jgi:hypothetical protein
MRQCFFTYDPELSVFNSFSRPAYALVFTIIFLLLKLCTQLQHPFFFNLIRNPSFESHSVKRSKRLFNRVLKFTYYWVNTIAPLVMLTYLSLRMEKVLLNLQLFLIDKIDEGNLGISFLSTVLLLRSFRWIWQNTIAALLELTIFVWLDRYVESFPLDTLFALFAFSIIHDRLKNFFSKLYYVLISIYTALVRIFWEVGNK